MKKSRANLKNVLGQADLTAIADLMGGLIDKQAAVLANKQDIKGLKSEVEDVKSEVKDLKSEMATKKDITELKDYMDQGFESVMDGIDAICEQLTEKEKFDRLVQWAKEVGDKVGVKVKI